MSLLPAAHVDAEIGVLDARASLAGEVRVVLSVRAARVTEWTSST